MLAQSLDTMNFNSLIGSLDLAALQGTDDRALEDAACLFGPTRPTMYCVPMIDDRALEQAAELSLAPPLTIIPRCF